MTAPGVGRATVSMLAEAHRAPGVSRADAARRLGMSSGVAADTAARLADGRLLSEGPGPRTHRRGRPTTTLLPHPDGPLVAVAAVAHETWETAVVELGGRVLHRSGEPHDRSWAAVRTVMAARWQAAARRHGARIVAWVVSVPGTVAGTALVQAPGLGWRDIDLRSLRPRGSTAPLLAGNDATLAGVAEHRRGAAVGVATAVHLYLDAGVGGVLIDGDVPVLGATGSAGEFGHLPLGSPRRRCSCGARGCWNTTLDGDAIARHLGAGLPADPVTYTREVLAAAAEGRAPERAAVRAVARSLGRGAAALVNALDPELVTLGGLGPGVLELAGDAADGAYRQGLMAFRADAPPPLVAGVVGADGPLIGGAEEGFAHLLTDQGIDRWLARGRRSAGGGARRSRRPPPDGPDQRPATTVPRRPPANR